MFELASENINGYIYPVSIHDYIQNKCLTYICEVGDPFLSQNLHRKYVISKAKQGGEMRENTRRCFKNYCIIFFGSTYKQKSCMAQSMLATAVARGRISWTGTTMPAQITTYFSEINMYTVASPITSAFLRHIVRSRKWSLSRTMTICGLRTCTMTCEHIEFFWNNYNLGIRSFFDCSPQQCSPWTHPWVESGSPVDVQSHQDILKEYKHHNRS